jgi:hypothetical protein
MNSRRKEILTDFLHKFVKIGTPHYEDSNRKFFVFGTLIEIDNVDIIIRTSTGDIEIIPIDDVLSISVTKPREG